MKDIVSILNSLEILESTVKDVASDFEDTLKITVLKDRVLLKIIKNDNVLNPLNSISDFCSSLLEKSLIEHGEEIKSINSKVVDEVLPLIDFDEDVATIKFNVKRD